MVTGIRRHRGFLEQTLGWLRERKGHLGEEHSPNKGQEKKMCSRDSAQPSWNRAENGHIKLKGHDGLDQGYPYMTGRDVVGRGGMEKSRS